MKGLILKDLLLTKKTIIYMLVIAGLFGGVYASMDSNYFLAFFSSIMMVSIILSTMSYDEFYHWDRYALTLPISRRRFVLAKFFTTYILFFVGTLFAVWIELAAMYLKGQPFDWELVGVMSIGPATGLIGTAIVLPCCYKFGLQKARFAMLICYGLPSILLVLVLKMMPDLLNGLEESLIHLTFRGLVGIVYGVMAVMQVVSFLLSVRIMERKEL